VSMAGALAWFWYVRGHYREGRTWLDRALQRAERVPAPIRAKALALSGRLALLQCDYERAHQLCTRAVAVYQEAGDEAGAAAATEVLGSIARERGDCAASVRIFEASCERALRAGDDRAFARATNYVAFACWLRGDGDAARERVPAALEIFEATGDAEGRVWAHLNLAGAALHGGSLQEAGDEAALALRLAREAAYPEGVAWALDLLGRVRLAGGDRQGAEAAFDEALPVHKELGDQWRAASILEGQAQVAAASGAWDRCARLLGQAAGVRARIGAPVPEVERPAVLAAERAAEETLGAEPFTRARTSGARQRL
jgi:tetratricopeptide (TPR) repeat protein